MNTKPQPQSEEKNPQIWYTSSNNEEDILYPLLRSFYSRIQYHLWNDVDDRRISPRVFVEINRDIQKLFNS